MHEYSSLIFDLDNTAIPDGSIEVTSQRLIDVISSTSQKIPCIAATGRTPELALPVTRQLALSHYSVVANGAALMNPSTGELTDQQLLTTDQVENVLKECSNEEYKIIIEGSTEKTLLEIRKQPCETLGVFVLGLTQNEAQDIAESLNNSVTGLFVYVSEGWSDDGEPIYDVNISHELAAKERAVERALGIYSLSIEEAVFVGDGPNDLEVMSRAGLAVAVENAHPEIIKIADLIIPNVFNDGLAMIVEQLF